MFGKGALIFVAGFALIFAMYQAKLNRLSVTAADNFNYHYMESLVHESAMSAMNIGINDVWSTNTDSGGYNIIVPPCTSQVTISSAGLDTVMVKVKTRSRIFQDDYYALHNTTLPIIDSMYAYFTYDTPVSRYFWFTNSDAGVYWITGDTVWGPIHCNHVLRTNGSPVFFNKVTARLGISPNPSSKGNKAHFYGGWEVGIDASLPTDMSQIVAAATAGNGGAPMNTKSLYDQVLDLEFLADGRVIRSVGGAAADTVQLDSIAPTGVLYATDTVHVSGVFNGEATIYTTKDIRIDDDVTYANNPLVDPSSDDILGLVSDGNVVITDNGPNNHDVTIQASVITPNGSFVAENYHGRPISGTLSLCGSIAQGSRGAVGTFSSWSGSITHGFHKNYYYDPRLRTKSPPYYPYIRVLRLVSWWE